MRRLEPSIDGSGEVDRFPGCFPSVVEPGCLVAWSPGQVGSVGQGRGQREDMVDGAWVRKMLAALPIQSFF